MRLNILEPTLINTSGHCYGLASQLIAANKLAGHHFLIHIWIGNSAKKLFSENEIQVHEHFSKRWRRVQMYQLMWQLLGQGEHIFVPTAARTELWLYAMLPKAIRNRGKAAFYVHQLSMRPSQTRHLKHIAKQVPDITIFCTHTKLRDHLLELGFRNCQVQPYPLTIPNSAATTHSFRHLVFPGIARLDKGFDIIADMTRLLAEKEEHIPLLIQAGPNHHGEYAPEISRLMETIEGTRYPHLQMLGQDLSDHDYRQQFLGGICLQPYDPNVFHNRHSGVTLDAIAAACPVIARSGTWTGDLVEQYGFGKCIETPSAETLLEAVHEIISNYTNYQHHCAEAWKEISYTHHPERLLHALLGL